MSKSTNEIERGIAVRVAKLWADFDRHTRELQDHYLSSGSPSVSDRDAYQRDLAGLIAVRDADLKLAEQEAGRVSVKAEREFGQAIRTDSPPRSDDVVNAWEHRVLPMLRGGSSVEQIAALSTTTRADIAALREYWPAHAAAEAGPSAVGSTRFAEGIRQALRTFDAFELRTIGDPNVAEIIRDERDRQKADEALNVVFGYSKQRQASPGNVAPIDEIQLGFRVGTALEQPAHEPGQRSHESILDEVDPGWRAKASRNAASPELRDALTANANDVGWRTPPTGADVGGVTS